MVYWHKFDPSAFTYEFDEEELAGHDLTVDEAAEVFWNSFDVRRNKRRHGGYVLIGWTDAGRPVNLIVYEKSKGVIRDHRMVMMTKPRKTHAELERQLKADARDRDAWEYVATVPASKSPRPAWYGRTKHLEVASKLYVLSVLHRLGAEANLTYAQPDNVDITAVRQSGEALTIDVKTLTGTTDWAVEQFSARKHHFVVFVCFSGEWAHDPEVVPDLFIWQSENLRSVVAKEKSDTLSLPTIASRYDATAAWEQFTTRPAA